MISCINKYVEVIDLNSTEKLCGIYLIYCNANGGEYIGSSIDIVNRCNEHLRYLRNNWYAIDSRYDHKPYMQNSFNKYGEDTFQYFVIEECSVESLCDRETFYIHTMRPAFNTVQEAYRAPKYSELSPEQQLRKYAKFIATKTKNNTFTPSHETIQKTTETKRKNGFFNTPNPVKYLKMIGTKRINGTLHAPHLKARGRKRPTHSAKMKIVMQQKVANMTPEQRKVYFGSPGTMNGHLKGKLQFKNETTGIVEDMYAFEWTSKYGVPPPQLSRARHGRQNFIRDNHGIRWVKI